MRYLTTTLDEKVRDNYHCVLIARNYDGFLELNRMVSKSFNRNDNHFYYVPRITFDELFATSDNIIITTACVGGVFGKGDEQTQRGFSVFMVKNRHRCFFEIGHHSDDKQVVYNQKLVKLSDELSIPLIAGTDTHVLNAEHEKGRSILQASKNIHFDGEDGWDLKFKSYPELIAAYGKQSAIPEAKYMEAIANTNVMADIRDDTTLIFQWESNSAQQYLKKFMSESTLEKARSMIPNFSMLKWMSFGNGLLRPACASFRDSVADGVFYDNGFDALNEFLAPEAGRIAMQETIMRFLVQFCGYNDAESDNVRRAIAKKKGTEKLLPEIEERFIEYSSQHTTILTRWRERRRKWRKE